MKKTNTVPSFSKLKITWLLLALAGILAVGSYGWHVYTLFHDWQTNMPQPQIERLTRDLRLYHARLGRFPSTFTEINGQLWHTKPAPDYGHNGRRGRAKNYYYLYTRVKQDVCAIWALPVGPQQKYASSYFVVLAPGWSRIWKGKALREEMIAGLPEVPETNQLSELAMQEMPAQIVAGK